MSGNVMKLEAPDSSTFEPAEAIMDEVPRAYLRQSPNQPNIHAGFQIFMQGSTQHITPSSHVKDEDPLMHVDYLCQETCELREKEVDITKNVMVLDDE